MLMHTAARTATPALGLGRCALYAVGACTPHLFPVMKPRAFSFTARRGIRRKSTYMTSRVDKTARKTVLLVEVRHDDTASERPARRGQPRERLYDDTTSQAQIPASPRKAGHPKSVSPDRSLLNTDQTSMTTFAAFQP
ncbi:hypothetical protein DL1_03590 [Thioclava dalianensis]|uniref:Uncharacterized protein n=1 Tax=Thioclava dalianensis TaxID=1185766 RepID=A0A074TCW4_9RHOB|nr:hypothetical protein [Thioclava dalianensis]KEP69544.1 hypothetical protein DL1_03590 [Thioclava dalianensis]SFN68386.1 hypothetical protein SAMN05216224_10961 [Thioclava dalianensis]